MKQQYTLDSDVTVVKMTVIKVLLMQSYRKTLPAKYIATAGVRAILYEMPQYVA